MVQGKKKVERVGGLKAYNRHESNIYPHVFIEAGGLAKALGADDTLVRSVFLVHVQDVNAKSVTLLKRSAHAIGAIRSHIHRQSTQC